MKKQKKPIKKYIILAILVAIIILITHCATSDPANGSTVAADSVMAAGDECIYYNDTKNTIWRKDIYSEEVSVFAEKLKLLSADYTEVLATNGNDFIIMNNAGEVTDTIEGIVVDSAEITENYIYYKHIDSGDIVKMDRKTKEIITALPLEVDKFHVYYNQIVFTTKDKNMIYFYDMETGLPMGYFGDKLIEDFSVSEGFLVYNDMNNHGKLGKMNLSNGDEVRYKTVRTNKFVYKGGRVYYVDNVNRNKKFYKLEEGLLG